MENTEHNELFICDCHSTEHLLIFSYDDEMLENVYMSVHIVPESSLWKRIKNAFKYILGHRSRYGDFDEFIFNPKDWVKLQDITNFLKKTYEHGEQEFQDTGRDGGDNIGGSVGDSTE